MKILVPSLLLLFLSGTSGTTIEQQDGKLSSRSQIRQSLKTLLYQLMVYGAEQVSELHETNTKRQQLLWKSCVSLVAGIAENLEDIYKEVNKEIQEDFPVYYNNVIPIFKSFFTRFFENLQDSIRQISVSFVKKLQKRINPLVRDACEEISLIIQNRTIEEMPLFTLKPYREGVRKEVEAAKIKEENKMTSEQETVDAFLKENEEKFKKLGLFNSQEMERQITKLKRIVDSYRFKSGGPRPLERGFCHNLG